MPILLLVILLLGILFGLLTLGGLAAAIIMTGLLIEGVVVVAFILVTFWLVKIIIGTLIGKLILNAAKPGLGDHRIWPLLVGVPIVAVLAALPYIGWLFALAMSFFGLGSLWLKERKVSSKKA